MTVIVIAVLLQLVLQAAASSSLGLDDSAFWEAVNAKKASKTQAEVDKGFTLELTSFSHLMTNLSLTERVRMEVKRSQQRLASFHNQITLEGGSFDTKASFSSPVYSGQGSYLMTLKLGTPPVSYVAIADTGSDLVWFQGVPCNPCFRQSGPPYDPSKSSTYASTTCVDPLCTKIPKHTCSSTCSYTYGYGDQSVSQGDFSTDTVTLTSSSGGSTSFPNFGFGVGHSNKGTFSGTDGLVGLGQGPLSLVSQLGSQFSNTFSYCLTDFYSSPTVTSSLLLGIPGESVTYTPLLHNSANPSFYYVNLIGISVSGNPLNYPSGTFQIDSTGRGGFILDSGTTVTQLQSAAYTSLLAAMQANINYPKVDGSSVGFELCYDLSSVASPSVPSVTFKFQNVDVDLPGNNIFLQIDNAGTFCLAFQESSFSLGIFGNVQQQNFLVVHDLANLQVGFAPKKC